MATHITIPMARLIELETAEHERDIMREDIARLTAALKKIEAGYCIDPRTVARDALGPNAAGNRLARQGQSELTGLLGPGSEARQCNRTRTKRRG